MAQQILDNPIIGVGFQLVLFLPRNHQCTRRNFYIPAGVAPLNQSQYVVLDGRPLRGCSLAKGSGHGGGYIGHNFPVAGGRAGGQGGGYGRFGHVLQAGLAEQVGDETRLGAAEHAGRTGQRRGAAASTC